MAERRLAQRAGKLADLARLVEQHRGVAGMAGGEAFGAQQLVRNLPALVEPAQHVGARHPHVDEEFLGELGVALDGLDRPHRDAGRLEVDQQHGDAGVARLRLRIGAHQREHPVGEVAVGGPHLVAVDDEVVAVEFGPRGETCQVGTGAGFRIALAPGRLASEDRRQVLRLLGRRAGVDDQRPDEVEAMGIGRRRADPADLFEQDDLLRERRAHAADFLRPVRRDPAALVELAMPGLEFGRVDTERPVTQIGRQVVGDPVAHLLPEGAVGRVVVGEQRGVVPRHNFRTAASRGRC